jgi:hypothetical protein
VEVLVEVPVEVKETVGVAVVVPVEVLVEVPVEVNETVGDAVVVPVEVREAVEVVEGVLLLLGHVAPTQQTAPYSAPPALHSQDTQHPPPAHANASSNLLVLGFEHVPQ